MISTIAGNLSRFSGIRGFLPVTFAVGSYENGEINKERVMNEESNL